MDVKPMLAEFQAFLVKTNAVALGVAIVLGLAVKSLVDGVVECFIQPIIDLVKLGSGPFGLQIWIFQVGRFIGIAINFVIVAWVVFLLSKWVLREGKSDQPAKA